MKTNERITGPSILSSWIRSICQTVRGYGIDPLPLMERAGLDSQLLNIPEARYAVSGVRRLWRLIITTTGEPLVGLRVGREIQVSTLHGLGLAMVSSSSLSMLLSLFVRYGKVISTTMQLDLTHDRDGTTLTVKSNDGSERMCAACLASPAFIFRQACSLALHEIRPHYVTLTLSCDAA